MRSKRNESTSSTDDESDSKAKAKNKSEAKAKSKSEAKTKSKTKVKVNVESDDVAVTKSKRERSKGSLPRPASKDADIDSIGVPRQASPAKNCLSCRLFLSCHDDNKSHDYRCSLWRSLSSNVTHLKPSRDIDDTDTNDAMFKDILNDKKKGRREREVVDSDSEDEFTTLIESTLTDEGRQPVARDLKIDDHDIPQAPNFFEWVTGKEFLNFSRDGTSPWAKQIQIGLNMFSEYCVTGGTRLFTSRGLLNMDEMSRHPMLDEATTSLDGVDVIDGFMKTGIDQRCISIETANGANVECTPTHPICVAGAVSVMGGSWKLASWVTVGDELMSRYGDDLWPSSPAWLPSFHIHGVTHCTGDRIDAELARLTAYVVGRGKITGHRVKIMMTDSESLVDLDDCLKSVCRRIEMTDDIYERSRIYEKFCIGKVVDNVVLAEFLSVLCDPHNNHHDTSTREGGIPYLIRRSDRATVIEFLRALFKCTDSYDGSTIKFTTPDRQLAVDVSLMLQNLGVVGSISKREVLVPGLRISYTVKRYEYQYSIVDWDEVTRFHIILGLPDWYMNEPVRQPSLPKRMSVATKMMIKPVRMIKTRVTATREIGGHDVYDITVRRAHSFHANGFIVHNCPNCSDKEYVKDIPLNHRPDKILEKVQLLEYGKCPKCEGLKTQMWCAGEYPKLPSEVALLLGQRSGKSTTSALAMTYQLHAYMKMQSPAKAFKLPSNTILHGIVTALTWKSAQELLYDPVYTLMLDSPFFNRYHDMLDYYGNKYGQQLYRLNVTGYINRARNVSLYPMGPDRKKMRGRTGYLAGIDEIGLFNAPDEAKSASVKENAEEVYNSLRNSLNTLRPAYYKMARRGHASNIIPPMLYAISSPMSKRDMMVRLYERSVKNPRVYGLHAATWEINPEITYDDLMEEFKFDGGHSKVMRDFGAVPPNSSLPWIEDVTMVHDSVDRGLVNRVNVLQSTRRIEGHVVADDTKAVHYRTGKFVALSPKDGIKRAMAMDAGFNDNSFALVAGFWDLALNRPIIDSWLEIIPTHDNPINFSFLYDDVIVPFMEFSNVQLVISDRWQNKKILHDMESQLKVTVAEHSVKYDSFSTYKSELINGNVTIPNPKMSPRKIEEVGDTSYPMGFIGEPVAHFVYQCVSVQDTGKSVDKGDGTTDDLLRASVLLHTFLIDPDPDVRSLCSGLAVTGSRFTGPPGMVGLFSVPITQQSNDRRMTMYINSTGGHRNVNTLGVVGLRSSVYAGGARRR